MQTVQLSAGDLALLKEALAMAAARKEAQARFVRFGRHHDERAAAMRRLRGRLCAVRAGLPAGPLSVLASQ